MSENPYRVRGDRIPQLYGRERLVERLLRHPTLFGKSVLLNHVASCRPVRDHYVASVYWDLRHGTPRTNVDFRRRLAEEIRRALASAHLDVAEYLEPDEEALGDLLRLVLEDLNRHGHRLLVVLDGFDHVLAEPRITRNWWDEMRELALQPSLRFVTGSRERLRELCRTEESRTSDFWEIFYDTPVEIGCFAESDWSGFLEPFESKDIKLDDSARKEIANWTGGIPVLAAALARQLYSASQRSVTLSKSHVDSVAESFLATPGESLPALWDDCSVELKSDLTELARGIVRSEKISPPRQREVKLRGFATASRAGFQSSCRFMKGYAAEHGERVTNLRRIFGDADGFEENVRSLLELRIDHVVGVDPALVGYVRKAVRDLTRNLRSPWSGHGVSRSGPCHLCGMPSFHRTGLCRRRGNSPESVSMTAIDCRRAWGGSAPYCVSSPGRASTVAWQSS